MNCLAPDTLASDFELAGNPAFKLTETKMQLLSGEFHFQLTSIMALSLA